MIALLAGLALLGCEREAALRADPSTISDAVAQVNGDPVRVAEVAARARETGLSPKEALAQLVTERLVVQTAEARGYGALPEVVRAVQRARVRALLADEIERGTAPDDVAGRARRLSALLADLRRQTEVKFVDAGVQAVLTAQFR